MASQPGQFPDLRGRGILVTGGGSGIGAALVEGFARQGARVAFFDIAETESRELAARLSAEVEHPVHFLPTDLRDVSAIRASVNKAAEAIGAIGVLVNNAGWDDRHDLETADEAYWDANQAVNLKHHFFTTQAVLPHMRAAGRGSIVNMSSIAYLLHMGDLPAYAAAKAGIVGLTKSLAGKLGPEKIRVNCIMPGMIVTERQKRLWLTEEGVKTMLDRQCLKRILTAEDLVGPCLFLASDCSAGMTAQSIIVDGGIF
ncbi:SDR family oxidoreductase [Rhizobiaceae bacterium n13]|uniref:SDR family oxidoreductase n=1 Tax=Ferirhizobium litorale TaxID=2927786 RepID=A0AAE3Q9E8_9HYPH|nr:SDR family oxidoreductase [Fererhizobium litorale]MDI7861521.1 SDR family oxidoreductase [Fererhizobium litorale]MDI7921667.1 SDR family oxidoreductase [Fererhizobium litorale]